MTTPELPSQSFRVRRESCTPTPQPMQTKRTLAAVVQITALIFMLVFGVSMFAQTGATTPLTQKVISSLNE